MLRSGDHLRPRDFKSFPGKTGHKTLSGRDLPSDGATFPGQHWSVLYPIIALTYVWVTILSPMFFNDVINAYKVIGVGLIVVGVSFIGLGSRS